MGKICHSEGEKATTSSADINMGNNTPTIITLRKSEVVETLESLLEMAKKGEISGLIAAGSLASGEVFTAVSKVDSIQQHMLNSYLQTATIMRIVKENMD